VVESRPGGGWAAVRSLYRWASGGCERGAAARDGVTFAIRSGRDGASSGRGRGSGTARPLDEGRSADLDFARLARRGGENRSCSDERNWAKSSLAALSPALAPSMTAASARTAIAEKVWAGDVIDRTEFGRSLGGDCGFSTRKPYLGAGKCINVGGAFVFISGAAGCSPIAAFAEFG